METAEKEKIPSQSPSAQSILKKQNPDEKNELGSNNNSNINTLGNNNASNTIERGSFYDLPYLFGIQFVNMTPIGSNHQIGHGFRKPICSLNKIRIIGWTDDGNIAIPDILQIVFKVITCTDTSMQSHIDNVYS